MVTTDFDINPSVQLLHTITRTMSRYADKVLNEKLDISMAQLIILMYIDSSLQACNQDEVCHAIGITPAAISRHIKNMIHVGWVTSQANPLNRRANIIELTTSGRQLYNSGKMILESITTHLFSVLSHEENQQLEQLLTKLFTHLTYENE